MPAKDPILDKYLELNRPKQQSFQKDGVKFRACPICGKRLENLEFKSHVLRHE